MSKRVLLKRPSPAMIVAIGALFAGLGGSAIADGAAEVAKRAKLIHGKQIKKRTVQGNRLKRDTLTGTEINESKLAVVPSANRANSAASADNAKSADSAKTATSAGNASTVGGVGPEAFTVGRSNKGSCNPTDATKVACASTAFTLPRSGRVLVVADTMWHSNSLGITRGSCNVSVDGNDASGDTFPGQVSNNSDATHESSIGINLVTDVLGAGAHTFALACNQLQNDIQFNESFISAVMIGSA